MVKPLKIAGILGIIVLILTIIPGIILFSMALKINSSARAGVFPNMEGIQQQIESMSGILVVLLLIASVLSIGFLYGFVALGKRFNNKMLYITAWIFIVLAILGFILTLVFYITGNLYPENQTEQSGSSIGEMLKQKANDTPVIGAILNVFGDAGFWPLLILFAISGVTLQLFFGIGLYKLKDEVSLSGWAGAFEMGSIIIASLGTIAIILEIIMFFKASKKFESETLQDNNHNFKNQI